MSDASPPGAGRLTVVVTGATSGIGRATVARLCTDGHTVHAVGRRRRLLEDIARTTGARAVVADVRDTDAIIAQMGPAAVDVIVNNAGILSGRAPFHRIDPAEIDSMIDVNLKAPMHLARAFLPGMIERRRGHLVFVGSSGGRAPFPGMSVYGSSKAGLSMFCDDLRCDLLGTSVRVTEVVPGRVQTELYHTVMNPEQATAELYDGYRPLQPGHIADLIAYVIGLPDSVDVSRIEVFPTDQATGGATIVRFGEASA
jgi:NADP-dependent 3-hydroxy acid dehydrogenase YdfG